MQRTDLSSAILQLKALGIDNVLRFNFPSSPPSKNLLAGVELLYALGAINNDGELTSDVGLTMAELPLEPIFAKCLIASGKFHCFFIFAIHFFFIFIIRNINEKLLRIYDLIIH